MSLLTEVADLLAERGVEYGPPADHHQRTADMWQAAFGWDVGPREVALAIALDKFIRARSSPGKKDHYADIIGYVAIAWEHVQ